VTRRQLNLLLVGLFVVFMAVSIAVRAVAGADEARIALGAVGLATALGLLVLSRRERGPSRLRQLGVFFGFLGGVLVVLGVRGLD
jgi:hypothetical protein